VRGSRPNDGRNYDLGEALVPIPVIELPWDHLGSAWEYLSLHHEVGHDIEADLALRPTLQSTLRQKLAAGNVAQPQIDAGSTGKEVFADPCASLAFAFVNHSPNSCFFVCGQGMMWKIRTGAVRAFDEHHRPDSGRRPRR
jgi:hypothetical protein